MLNNPTGLSLNSRTWILAFFTVGLLCLYVWSIFDMIHSALACNFRFGVPIPPECRVTERLATLTTTLQSLISAIVISVLAISPAKGPLNLSHFGITANASQQAIIASYLALAYVAIWFVAGAAALGVGYIVLDDTAAAEFKALTDVGGSWLGLAVGAVYAYFGIESTQKV